MTEQYARPTRIMLVEDNPGDVLLAKRALRKSGFHHMLDVCMTGEEALRALRKEAGFESRETPNLILLDLNLPMITGYQVLQEIKADPDLKTIPVIIFTSSNADDDVLRAYESSANGYLVKPHSASDFVELAKVLRGHWVRFGVTPPA
jgi:CheY-like chemotaxis protein